MASFKAASVAKQAAASTSVGNGELTGEGIQVSSQLASVAFGVKLAPSDVSFGQRKARKSKSNKTLKGRAERIGASSTSKPSAKTRRSRKRAAASRK